MRNKRLWRPICAFVLLLLAAVCVLIALGQMQQQKLLFWSAVVLLLGGAAWTIAEGFLARKNLIRYVSEMSDALTETGHSVPEEMRIPIVILNERHEIIWYNSSFYHCVAGGMDLFGKPLQTVLPIDYQKLMEDGVCEATLPAYAYRIFRTVYQDEGKETYLLCFQDITAHMELRRRFFNTRLCAMHIVVDNFEDLFNGTRQSERAAVLAALEDLFEKALEGSESIFCRLDEDRFLVITEYQYYQKMETGRFPLLDEARKILVGGKTPLTLSIGVGKDGATFAQNESFAQQSLDMALGRGGDQAAVKTKSGYTFYGGVSKGVEHKSKTRYRAIARALQEMIEGCEQVLVMGHRFSDLDAVGSAVGVAFIAEELGKPANIAIKAQATLAKPLVERLLRERPSLLISPEEARERMTENTLLVIVDTMNKDILEDVSLYQMAKHVVVIDHHRKMVNYIDNTILSLHEPHASSASELVAEMIQYLDCRDTMPQLCAESLLSGIMLDTKNFVMQTGVHTFEAAAYLRQRGADPIVVKTLFAATMTAYRQRSRLVVDAELHRCCAITVAREAVPDIQIIASQTADELLGIEGVDASFVIFPNGNMSCISARSLGKMNVQVIMEQLGGGGHQTMAAAQRTDCTPSALRLELIAALDALDTESAEQETAVS